MDKSIIKKYAMWARKILTEDITKRLYELEKTQKKEHKQIIEDTAYIWFSRSITLYFMDVNDYIPKDLKIFSFNKLDKTSTSKKDFIKQCNALNTILPRIFEIIPEYIESLYPEVLLKTDGIIDKMIKTIPIENWKDNVQIIGWLYQYYNTAPKNKVFNNLKKNIKIERENIPIATQLFTPDWIVRYMVENSLGKLWIENSLDVDLKSNWEYYIDDSSKNIDAKERYINLKPSDIKCIDPCCGSGHILVYIFDVLMQIYKSVGYSIDKIPDLIIENNIYGLDIDDKTSQFAYFSIMMKARFYNSNFFQRKKIPQPQIYSPRNYDEGFEYGSLIKVDELEKEPLIESQRDSWNFRRLLNQKYDVVITNPPYMSSANMNSKLSSFIKENYADYKWDFFSAFIVRCTEMTKKTGYLGFLTPYVWMFIKSYENLRKLICNEKTIESLVQFEYSAFEEATVPICTFVLKNSYDNKNSCYIRLTDFKGGMEIQRIKTLEAINNHSCGFYYEKNSSDFSKIYGRPIAYWVKENLIKIFENSRLLGEYIPVKKGMDTGNNAYFLKMWYEVNNIDIDLMSGTKKWIPYNKGGCYRKWYGNNEYVLNWENNGEELKRAKANLRSKYLYFKKSITWNALTSGNTCFRYSKYTGAFDSAGSSMFPNENDIPVFIGFLNTNVCQYILNIINPTLNYGAGSISSVPILFSSEDSDIKKLSNENIAISREDWDSSEISWDFQKHPLI